MPRSPTLREIAAIAGVHHTTLSRALRHHPDIKASRAAELRALAEKLGYVPDPMLRGLAAYRTGRRPAAFHSVIAWLNPTSDAADARRYRTYRDYYEGASVRARELGFHLELVTLPKPGSNACVTSILKARNITGIIVGPSPALGTSLKSIDWKNFSAVRIGHTLVYPHLHTVAPNCSNSMFTIMNELLARGYRRPALLLESQNDERTGHLWSAMFLRQQMRLARRNRLPLYLPPHRIRRQTPEWVAEHRPDVIIIKGDEALPPLLADYGFQIPRDLGMAALVQPNEGAPVSGIDENSLDVGTAAVDLVVAMMNRQERGIPKNPHTLLIDNIWIEGKTLLPINVGIPVRSIPR